MLPTDGYSPVLRQPERLVASLNGVNVLFGNSPPAQPRYFNLVRLEDRTVAAEQKIALPLPLRAIWTNEQLHSIKLTKMDEKRQSGETEAKATQQRRAPLPRRGAKKLARVDDQFAAGEPGLVDSQEYPFLKKPGLEYYTTKEKRNEMSLYNPD